MAAESPKFNPMDYPIRYKKFWEPIIETNQLWEVRDRVSNELSNTINFIVPPELIEYLTEDCKDDGLTCNPEKMPVNDKYFWILESLRETIQKMPKCVINLFKTKIVSIFVMKDFGSDAWMDCFVDENNVPCGCFIVLNHTLFDERLDIKMKKAESNLYLPNHFNQEHLEAHFENPYFQVSIDMKTVEFVLYRIMASSLSLTHEIFPHWSRSLVKSRNPGDYSFSKLSWELSPEQKVIPSVFPDRKHKMFSIEELTQLNFVCFSAMSNMYADFGYSFAFYIYCVILGRKFAFVNNNNSIVYVLDWKEARLSAKKKIIRSFFQ